MEINAIRVTHPNCKHVTNVYQYQTEIIRDTYGATVKRLLEKYGSFILLEHDNDPSPDEIKAISSAALMFENKPVLAARYWIYPITTGLDYPVCAHRPDVGKWLTEPGFKPVKYFGLGCTYIPKAAAPLIDPSWDYPALDYQLSQAWLDAGYEAYALPIWVEHHHKE